MNWPSICAAVIPCLNEAGTINRVADEVRHWLPTVIVVDDGSTDGTSTESEKAGAVVVRHDQSMGKGTSMCDGWQKARSMGFNWALCLDGDGQHSPADIPSFLKCAEDTGAAMVIGNRMSNPTGMPWLRRQVNRWMSRRLSRLSGQSLPDTQNGFRLMDLRCWDPKAVEATHFEIESDVLIAYLLAGHRVEFVPVEVIYESERSKIRPWHDTIRWLQWWRQAGRRFHAH